MPASKRKVFPVVKDVVLPSSEEPVRKRRVVNTFGTAPKYEREPTFITPAPNLYQIKNVVTHAKKKKTNSLINEDFAEREIDFSSASISPGPGAYFPHYDEYKPKFADRKSVV